MTVFMLRRALLWLGLGAVLYSGVVAAADPEVPVWRRFVLDLPGASYSGNPFELEVDATFTHTASGTRITLPGYYAGSSTWKVGFMPTRAGEWTYTTSSSFGPVDGVQGSLSAVSSGLPGLLEADPTHPRKWKFADGSYVVPIGLRFDVPHEQGSTQRFSEVADFLENEVGGHFLEFTLRNDVFSDWRAHEFDLGYWDLLEQRMEILAARGLGIHYMFYTDDSGEPPWGGQSSTELLLIRYTIARLAGYPIVIHNTGIDISEYRSSSDIDWMGAQILALDPYGHPVSSRRGGGSGSILMDGQTFDSRGDRRAEIDTMIAYFENGDVPVGMDDAWHENSPEAERRGKDFSEHDIRRAVWKCVLAGGLEVILRGSHYVNEDAWFRMDPSAPEQIESDLESEQFLGLINPFVERELGSTFGAMVPEPSLVSNGYAIADPARTKILYLLMGKNDRYDGGDGGDVTVRLSGLSGTYTATWFDPRTGSETAAGVLAGGSNHVLTPPSTDDWVLYVRKPSDSSPPSIPQNVQTTPRSESQIDLSWAAAADAESGISHYRVFRDGDFIGQSPTTSYSDGGLSEGSTYSYEVSAVNGGALESGRSTPASGTTLADTTPPGVESVGTIDPTQVVVRFDEPVDDATATDEANYGIDGGVVVSGASLQADDQTVVLTTSAHTEDQSYVLTINNVKDRARSPNTIPQDTQVGYTFESRLIISNLVVASGAVYEIAENLGVGSLAYSDRSYVYDTVPTEVLGSTYIKTANDDKQYDATADLLSFDVNRAVTVYVVHDNRYATKPAWLSTFVDSGLGLKISSAGNFSLYARDYPPGTVTLGVNQNPAEVEDNSMYTVIVVADDGTPGGSPPSPPANLSVR